MVNVSAAELGEGGKPGPLTRTDVSRRSNSETNLLVTDAART
jgi:hypothetical protein